MIFIFSLWSVHSSLSSPVDCWCVLPDNSVPSVTYCTLHVLSGIKRYNSRLLLALRPVLSFCKSKFCLVFLGCCLSFWLVVNCPFQRPASVLNYPTIILARCLNNTVPNSVSAVKLSIHYLGSIYCKPNVLSSLSATLFFRIVQLLSCSLTICNCILLGLRPNTHLFLFAPFHDG
jgi:hypothetical protein